MPWIFDFGPGSKIKVWSMLQTLSVFLEIDGAFQPVQ